MDDMLVVLVVQMFSYVGSGFIHGVNSWSCTDEFSENLITANLSES